MPTNTRAQTAAQTANANDSEGPETTAVKQIDSAPKSDGEIAPTPSSNEPIANEASGDDAREKWGKTIESLENRVRELEDEKGKLVKQIGDLRDKMEEEVWARKRLEEKLEGETMRAVPVSEDQQEWRRELKNTEDRIMRKLEEEEERRTATAVAASAMARPRTRCVIISDSNGRNSTTPESVRSHLPADCRDDFDIELFIAYRVEEAEDKVKSGGIDAKDAYIIIDCLSNNARDTRTEPALSPIQLVIKLDTLRTRLWTAGAAGIVVCALKPTQRTDVTFHNEAVHAYLRDKMTIDGGGGCGSQTRLEYLGRDGLHVRPQFYRVIQEKYACIISGKPLPSPTPADGFVPDQLRQAREREWPSIGNGNEVVRANNQYNGWRW